MKAMARVAAVGLLSFLPACAAGIKPDVVALNAAAVPRAPDDRALIVFMFPLAAAGAFANPHLSLYRVTPAGEQFIGLFDDGHKLAYLARPGSHTFMVAGIGNSDLMKADVAAGQTYVVVLMGLPHDNVQTVPRYGFTVVHKAGEGYSMDINPRALGGHIVGWCFDKCGWSTPSAADQDWYQRSRLDISSRRQAAELAFTADPMRTLRAQDGIAGAAATPSAAVAQAADIAPSPAAGAREPGAVRGADAKARMRELKSMLDEGLITQEQYDKKRQEILDSM